MEEKKCKNKKCQRVLPKGYKYKYCEQCRIKRTEKVKNAGKGILTTAVTVITVSAAIVANIKSNGNNK